MKPFPSRGVEAVRGGWSGEARAGAVAAGGAGGARASVTYSTEHLKLPASRS